MYTLEYIYYVEGENIMAELNTTEKIRLMISRSGQTLYPIAESTGQTRQNFSNKLKRANFKESELRAIADAAGCE